MILWWELAGCMGSVAVGAGFADRRRRHRVDPDQIGMIDWPGVQLLAVAVAIVAVSIALRS